MRVQVLAIKTGLLLSTALLLPVCMCSAAFAAEVKAVSKIDAVTVFPQGAEVTRTAKVRLEAGEHVIVLPDLIGQAIETSIRVEGKATGKLEIGSVDTRRTPVLSGDPAIIGSARKKLEDDIQKQQDTRAGLDDIIKVAEAQKAYLDNLAKLPTLPVPVAANTVAPREDWGALFTTIATRMAETAKTMTDSRIKQREIDKTIVDLQKELATVGRVGGNRLEVRINAAAAAPLDATLTVRYQVGGANWTPLYDARLSTGDKATAPKLSIARRAQITQQTGEDWDDVTLALSTTRPGRATAAPDLNMLSVDFLPDQLERGRLESNAPAAPVPMAKQSAGRGVASGGMDAARDKLAEADRKDEDVSDRRAQATIGAFQAVFDIPGRASIKTTGEAKRVEIAKDELEPGLIIRTVPRLDQTAYLYAKLVLAKTASPLLPGQVALFRDGVFVGQGRMPQLAPGEDHELGFSADDRVKVKRVVLEDKKGDTGIFTTSRVEERNYAITIKNLHARAIQIQVIDRIPVPMHQDIKVDVAFKDLQPTKKDVNDKRGTVMWDLKAEPDEEKSLAFGYRITAPANKKIQYRELTQEQIQMNQIMRF